MTTSYLRKRVLIFDNSAYQSGSPWPHFRGNAQCSGVSNYTVTNPIYNVFKFPVDNNIESSPTISLNGNVYFGDSNGNIYSITSTGSQNWKVSFDTQPILSSVTLSNDGTIYVGSDNQKMYALTTKGTLKWSYKTDDWVRSSAAITNTGNIIFSSVDGVFYSLTSLGTQVWNFTTQYIIVTVGASDLLPSPVINEAGDAVYIGGMDGLMYSLDVTTGVKNWEFQTGSNIYATPALGNDGVLYFGSGDGYIYAVSPTGSMLYTTSTSVNPLSSCSMSPSRDVIYVGVGSKDAYTGGILALYTNLTIKWSFDAGSEVYSSPAIDANGNLFFGTNGLKLYSISSSGSAIGYVKTVGSVRSSPAISKNGNIYIGTNGNNLWAFSTVKASNNNGLSRTDIIILCVVLIVSCCICSICILIYCLYRRAKNNINDNYDNYDQYNNNIDNSTNKVTVIGTFANLFISKSSTQHSKSRRNKNNSPFTVDDVTIPQINWYDIKVDHVEKPEDSVLGKGSFGTVYKAKLEIFNDKTKTKILTDVVVKVMTESVKSIGSNAEKDEKLLDIAKFEAAVVIEAESRMVIKDSIIKVYGIASGPVPFHLSRALEISGNCSAIGIVMRSEEGGSLQTLLHPTIKGEEEGNNSATKKNNNLNSMTKSTTINTTNAMTIATVVNNDKFADYNNTNNTTATNTTGNDAKLAMSNKLPPPLEMIEKLRLLMELAKGIADMHAAGIIHGDLKPDNVLLSADTPSKVRLADFGLATLRVTNNSGMMESTLQKTSATRGTPVYCAPEMFVNPYAQILEDKVAKASRKTDMYAFALIAWEVLTQKKPFGTIQKEMLLVAQIYSGARPPIAEIPEECSKEIIDMIELTWSLDRLKRRTALECYNLLQLEYSSLSKTGFDVYISYHSDDFHVAKYIFIRLTQAGYIVCLIPMTRRKNKVVTDEIEGSAVIVALLNQKFQNTSTCMSELSIARNPNNGNNFAPTSSGGSGTSGSSGGIMNKIPKTIYPVLLEANYEEWSDMQLQYLCQLKSTGIEKFDFSAINDIHPHYEPSSQLQRVNSNNDVNVNKDMDNRENNLGPVDTSSSSSVQVEGMPSRLERQMSLTQTADDENDFLNYDMYIKDEVDRLIHSISKVSVSRNHTGGGLATSTSYHSPPSSHRTSQRAELKVDNSKQDGEGIHNKEGRNLKVTSVLSVSGESAMSDCNDHNIPTAFTILLPQAVPEPNVSAPTESASLVESDMGIAAPPMPTSPPSDPVVVVSELSPPLHSSESAQSNEPISEQ